MRPKAETAPDGGPPRDYRQPPITSWRSAPLLRCAVTSPGRARLPTTQAQLSDAGRPPGLIRKQEVTDMPCSGSGDHGSGHLEAASSLGTGRQPPGLVSLV